MAEPRKIWAGIEVGLLAALAAVVVSLTVLAVVRRAGRADRLTDHPTPEYAGKIDPNAASWQTLAAGLPGIGEQKAKDIVAYREANSSAGPAFRTPADLARVRNIGLTTVERIAPFLIFPQRGEREVEPPASQPDP